MSSVFGAEHTNDLFRAELESRVGLSVGGDFDKVADLADFNESSLRGDILEKCFDKVPNAYARNCFENTFVESAV